MGKNIPAGYQLHIHSWENDGDSPNTEILSGLSKGDVAFYIDLLESTKKYGNTMEREVDDEEIHGVIQEVVGRHPGISETAKEDFTFESHEYLGDHIREVMFNLLGSSEHYDFRVFDGFEVYYYETPVKNVTKQFSKKAKA